LGRVFEGGRWGEFSVALGGFRVYVLVLKDINVKSAIQTWRTAMKMRNGVAGTVLPNRKWHNQDSRLLLIFFVLFTILYVICMTLSMK
jgi:hypothetical protein